MAGLDPAIQAQLSKSTSLDARLKAGHDGMGGGGAVMAGLDPAIQARSPRAQARCPAAASDYWQ
jgi:hypothetical protein